MSHRLRFFELACVYSREYREALHGYEEQVSARFLIYYRDPYYLFRGQKP